MATTGQQPPSGYPPAPPPGWYPDPAAPSALREPPDLKIFRELEGVDVAQHLEVGRERARVGGQIGDGLRAREVVRGEPGGLVRIDEAHVRGGGVVARVAAQRSREIDL